MNKSSYIRKKLESYGFKQVGNKNCFIAYYKDFCFQIKFEKAGYGSQWEIICGVYMLNAKRYELGVCPDSYTNISFLLENFKPVSLALWNAKKKRTPDDYSESIIYIIDDYISPFFSKIALFMKSSDFESSIYISKKDNDIIIPKGEMFKTIKNIQTFKNIEDLLPSFFNSNDYVYINSTSINETLEWNFYNRPFNYYLSFGLHYGIFISFKVISKDLYEFSVETGLTSLSFDDKSCYIGDEKTREKNLTNLLNKLPIEINAFLEKRDAPRSKSGVEKYMELLDKQYQASKKGR